MLENVISKKLLLNVYPVESSALYIQLFSYEAASAKAYEHRAAMPSGITATANQHRTVMLSVTTGLLLLIRNGIYPFYIIVLAFTL